MKSFKKTSKIHTPLGKKEKTQFNQNQQCKKGVILRFYMFLKENTRIFQNMKIRSQIKETSLLKNLRRKLKILGSSIVIKDVEVSEKAQYKENSGPNGFKS